MELNPQQVKRYLNEAEVYRNQGLLKEAKNKYEQAIEVIHTNRQKLIDAISEKIRTLESDLARVEKSEHSPQMSDEVIGLIKDSLTSPASQESVALREAVVLAKFGQFERALEEFNRVLQQDALSVDIAKNILRCHVVLSALDEAATQYRQWFSSGMFSTHQLETIRRFLEGILKKKGRPIDLPNPRPGPETNLQAGPTEEFSDIGGVGLWLNSSSGKKGEVLELDVIFQSRDTVNVIIPQQMGRWVESWHTGFKLEPVIYYLPSQRRQGAGIVRAKRPIVSGPQIGAYSLDLGVIFE